MKRVLLKLSGEALAGEQKRGFDEATVTEVAKQIKTIVDEGLQVGDRRWKLLERTYQRSHGQKQGGSDRHACYYHELYLCV